MVERPAAIVKDWAERVVAMQNDDGSASGIARRTCYVVTVGRMRLSLIRTRQLCMTLRPAKPSQHSI
jgi:hypothetical protein